MEIRLARERDRGHLIAAYMTGLRTSRPEAERFARAHMGLERCLLASEAGVVVGGVTWGVRGDVRSGLAEVTGLAVGDRVRRRGLGTLLLLMALEDMRAHFAGRGGRFRRAYLTADRENLPARRLYEKAGFRAQAQLPDHVEAGRTAILYALAGAAGAASATTSSTPV
jgi:ribosomal protein S18 acetylase RimI-like enzyme